MKINTMLPCKRTIAMSLFLAGMLNGLNAQAQQANLYVAPNGNDTAAGTLAAPFASLEKARDELRRLRAAGMVKGGVTVWVRGGLYALPRTLTFGKEDSGSAAAPVVFRAYQNEKPILIGGKAITNFTPYKGQILKADVGAQGFKDIYFRQLFFDGKRQHLARYPNFDANNPYGGGWAYADGTPVPMYADVPGEDKRTFTMKAADTRNWAKPEEGEVFVFPRFNWWNNIVRIGSYDAATRTIKLAGDASYPIRPGDRYYVQNQLEELDAPGEWYLDKATATLYFWPPTPLDNKTVYAPTLRNLVKMEGAANITLRGFTLECAEGDGVVVNNCNGCLIAANVIRNVGDYNGSAVSVMGGTKNGVAGNDIYEIGRDGVAISGGDRITLTAAENFADNNYIHHTGVFYKQGVGISLTGCGNRASHNYIHDGPRMGIMFSGNNLILEYNHIRHVNLETEDTGAVYTGGRDWLGSRGSVIRYNYFHDILGYGKDEKGVWQSPHFAWGVYLDDNTGGVDVIGNVVTRCTRGLIHLHNGRDNLIENNIFVDGTLQQVEYNGWTTSHQYWKTHLPTMIKGYESVKDQPAWKKMRNMDIHPTQAPLPDGKIMTGNVLRRNILYYHDPKARAYKMSTVPLDHNVVDSNLLFHFGAPILTGLTAIKGVTGPNLAPNGGFEEGQLGAMPARWHWNITPQGTTRAVLSDEEEHNGARSLRFDAGLWKDANGQSKNPMLQSDTFPAKPGATYRVMVWMKASKPDFKANLVTQAWKANTYHWYKDQPLSIGTDWKQYELVVRFPAPGEPGSHPELQSFYVRLDNRDESGTLWIDDVTVQEAVALDEWQAWQTAGQDTHSLIADPLFVNPDKDDYHLRPNSPAFKIGFQPIPLEKIGPYKDDLRASWPIVEAEGAREKPLVSMQP